MSCASAELEGSLDLGGATTSARLLVHQRPPAGEACVGGPGDGRYNSRALKRQLPETTPNAETRQPHLIMEASPGHLSHTHIACLVRRKLGPILLACATTTTHQPTQVRDSRVLRSGRGPSSLRPVHFHKKARSFGCAKDSRGGLVVTVHAAWERASKLHTVYTLYRYCIALCLPLFPFSLPSSSLSFFSLYSTIN